MGEGNMNCAELQKCGANERSSDPKKKREFWRKEIIGKFGTFGVQLSTNFQLQNDNQ